MGRIVNLSIWFIIGVLIVYFTSRFSIGTIEHWREQINNHLFELITVRTLVGTVVGAIWAVIAYFLYKAFATGEDKKLKFWKYFSLTTLGYLIVALISTLIFIHQTRA
jgi:uncharacterized membrane-anchored protein